MKIYWINLYTVSVASFVVAFINLGASKTSESVTFTFIAIAASSTAAAIREIEKRLNQNHSAKNDVTSATGKQEAVQNEVE